MEWIAWLPVSILLTLIYMVLVKIHETFGQIRDTQVSMRVLLSLIAGPTLRDMPEDIDEWNRWHEGRWIFVASNRTFQCLCAFAFMLRKQWNYSKTRLKHYQDSFTFIVAFVENHKFNIWLPHFLATFGSFILLAIFGLFILLAIFGFFILLAICGFITFSNLEPWLASYFV